MKNILFWKNETTDQTAAELKAENSSHLIPFVQEEPGTPYPCMIVLPGGGYEGLSAQEARRRSERYGVNRLPQTKRSGLGQLFLQQQHSWSKGRCLCHQLD